MPRDVRRIDTPGMAEMDSLQCCPTQQQDAQNDGARTHQRRSVRPEPTKGRTGTKSTLANAGTARARVALPRLTAVAATAFAACVASGARAQGHGGGYAGGHAGRRGREGLGAGPGGFAGSTPATAVATGNIAAAKAQRAGGGRLRARRKRRLERWRPNRAG